MADPKQEFIDRAIERLEQMKALLGQFILAKTEELNKMEEANEKPTEEFLNSVMEKMINTKKDLQNYMKEMAQEAINLGVSPKDPDMRQVAQIIQDMAHMIAHPGEYAKKNINRALEPIDNLGSVDVKVLSKEEIENKLFDLHDQQESATTPTDKARIQHEIDNLLDIYKQAKLRDKFVK